MSHRHLFPRARGYEAALPGPSHTHNEDEDSIIRGLLSARESKEFPGILFDLSASDFCFVHSDYMGCE